MIESEQDQPQEDEGGETSPEEPIHEATTPPGSGPLDEQAEREAEERLNQAGGGH